MKASEELARQGAFKDAVVALVNEELGGVTFVEVTRLLAPYMTVEGSEELFLTGYPTILCWQGMSHELGHIIKELLDTDTLRCSPTEWLVYLADGELVNLPLATQPIHYPTMHWLPVTLELGETGGRERDDRKQG